MEKSTKHSLRLLLHCEGGTIPYLTPYFLSNHFQPNNPLISQHLSLGIQLRETCVVPTYEQKVKKKTKQKKPRKVDSHSPKPRNLKEISNQSPKPIVTENCKPTGYTFVGRPISKHFRIPEGYNIISVPAFDILDQYKNKHHNNQKKNSSNSSNGSNIPPSTSKELILQTFNGYQKMNLDLFVNVIKGLEAKSISHVNLYDQSAIPFNDGSSSWKKKNLQSVDRTKLWTNKFLAKSQEMKNETNSQLPRIWLPIVGGDDLKDRVDSTTNAMSFIDKNGDSVLNDQIEGVAFVGLHHIPSSKIRKNILETCIPKTKNVQKAVLVTKDLHQIMEAAMAGVNVVGSDLPTALARSSKALVLDLHGWRNHSTFDKNERTNERNKVDEERRVGEKDFRPSTECEGREEKSKILRISESDVHSQSTSSSKTVSSKNGILDLRDKCHADDTSPLLRDCDCFCCGNERHSRAYIHHLVNSRELLSEILLFVHNLHHLLELMHELSVAIDMGKGEQFCDFIKMQLP